METYRYIKDGQERVVTGTPEEIAAEKAGVPFQPPVYPATVEHLDGHVLTTVGLAGEIDADDPLAPAKPIELAAVELAAAERVVNPVILSDIHGMLVEDPAPVKAPIEVLVGVEDLLTTVEEVKPDATV